jgi:homoserine acetyltransferase
MHLYGYVALMAPSVSIMDVLHSASPLYREIGPFLSLFSKQNEREEFLEASQYYISNFKRLINEKRCMLKMSMDSVISTTIIKKSGEKFVLSFDARSVLAICTLVETFHVPTHVVEIIMSYGH